MQLLFRTIIIFALSLAFLGGVGFLVQTRLQQLWSDQLLGALAENNLYLWNNLVEVEAQKIIDMSASIHTNSQLRLLLENNETEQILNFFLRLESAEQELSRTLQIAVFDRRENLIYNSVNRLNSRLPTPSEAVSAAASGLSERVTGFGYDDENTLFQSVLLPVRYDDEVVGVVVYSRMVDNLLSEFEGSTRAVPFVVNRYNRRVAGGDNELWYNLIDNFQENISIGGLFAKSGDHSGRVYRVIRFPVEQMFGNLQAFIMSADEVSDEYTARRDLIFIFNIIFVAVAIAILLMIAFILKRNFKPLNESSELLISLAKSEDIGSLGKEFNDDAVGRILNAVETLRLRDVYLKRLRRSRTKQRQRVHRLLLQEMSSLVDNLDPENRAELVEDLQAIKREIDGKHVGGDDEFTEESGNELVTVASAFRKLAFRVTEKQSHLNRAIKDLELALQTEVAYLALQKELNLAHDVQLSFIPDKGLKVGDIEILGYMQPAKTVGGDLFDYFIIDDDYIGFCVGDVSDKGVPAALFMMVARIVLWLIMRSHESVGDALSAVNNAIYANNPNNFFVSIFYGRLNVRTGRVDYVCAGHPPGIYVDGGSGETTELRVANDLVAGIFADVKYREDSVTLRPGDSLFVYSDGISEAMDSDGNQYSPQRLMDILSKSKGSDAKTMISGVIDDVKDFTDEAIQSDDITCIAIHYSGPGES